VLICGCRFRATDEEGKMLDTDADFVRNYEEKGIFWVLESVCQFDPLKYAGIFSLTSDQ
jgi:hypothetical protein